MFLISFILGRYANMDSCQRTMAVIISKNNSQKGSSPLVTQIIVLGIPRFTVVFLMPWPYSGSEAGVGLV